MKKIKLLFITVCISAFILMIFYIYSMNSVETMIQLLDRNLLNNHPELISKPLFGTYPIDLFLKDIIIYIGIYKTFAYFFSGLTILFITILSLLLYKKINDDNK